MIFRPNGLIPEKLLYIPGLKYGELVKEEKKVDWRQTKRKVGTNVDKRSLSFWKKKNSSQEE
jgi:hypothetical protein